MCSLPIFANALVTLLGGAQPLDMEAAKDADAIVILGGGVRAKSQEYGGDTIGRLTLERTRYGAYLARLTGLPVLVTGGSPKQGVRAEGELMQEVLELEFGVKVRWVEDQARDTHENAANAARILLAESKHRVVLVVHGFDVRRAVREFEAAGLQVIAAPTASLRWSDLDAGDVMPSVEALYKSHYALYEFLALGRGAFDDWFSGRSTLYTRQAFALAPRQRL